MVITVHQHKSVIILYKCIYTLPHEPPTPPPLPTPPGYPRAPDWTPCVIEQIPTSYMFYLLECMHVNYSSPCQGLLSAGFPEGTLLSTSLFFIHCSMARCQVIIYSGRPCILTSFCCAWFFVTPWSVAPRLLHPWDFPGKNPGVNCHALLQGSSWPRDWACVSYIAGRVFTAEPLGKPCSKLLR